MVKTMQEAAEDELFVQLSAEGGVMSGSCVGEMSLTLGCLTDADADDDDDNVVVLLCSAHSEQRRLRYADAIALALELDAVNLADARAVYFPAAEKSTPSALPTL